jgi:hypothetical protein
VTTPTNIALDRQTELGATRSGPDYLAVDRIKAAGGQPQPNQAAQMVACSGVVILSLVAGRLVTGKHRPARQVWLLAVIPLAAHLLARGPIPRWLARKHPGLFARQADKTEHIKRCVWCLGPTDHIAGCWCPYCSAFCRTGDERYQQERTAATLAARSELYTATDPQDSADQRN